MAWAANRGGGRGSDAPRGYAHSAEIMGKTRQCRGPRCGRRRHLRSGHRGTGSRACCLRRCVRWCFAVTRRRSGDSSAKKKNIQHFGDRACTTLWTRHSKGPINGPEISQSKEEPGCTTSHSTSHTPVHPKVQHSRRFLAFASCILGRVVLVMGLRKAPQQRVLCQSYVETCIGGGVYRGDGCRVLATM